jgi:hypothetical protein
MQGRQGQGSNGKNPLDRSATGPYRVSDRVEQYRESGGTGAYRFSELTGQQRAIPRRPPGMSHLDQPLPTPRVARPQVQHRERKPKTLKWWAGASIITVLALLVVGMIAYGATNFFLAISVNAGAASTAGDFLANLQSANYDQAFNDLAPAATAQVSKSDFKKMAQADDHCYGQVTNSNEVNNSAVTGVDGSQSFTYTITRSKLAKPYQMQLTLQKDASGDWGITSYGGDLGPAPPTCK